MGSARPTTNGAYMHCSSWSYAHLAGEELLEAELHDTEVDEAAHVQLADELDRAEHLRARASVIAPLARHRLPLGLLVQRGESPLHQLRVEDEVLDADAQLGDSLMAADGAAITSSSTENGAHLYSSGGRTTTISKIMSTISAQNSFFVSMSSSVWMTP